MIINDLILMLYFTKKLFQTQSATLLTFPQKYVAICLHPISSYLSVTPNRWCYTTLLLTNINSCFTISLQWYSLIRHFCIWKPIRVFKLTVIGITRRFLYFFKPGVPVCHGYVNKNELVLACKLFAVALCEYQVWAADRALPHDYYVSLLMVNGNWTVLV